MAISGLELTQLLSNVTSSGPYKKYMGQFSVQMLCLQLGETWLCTIAFISIFLVTSLRTIKKKVTQESQVQKLSKLQDPDTT